MENVRASNSTRRGRSCAAARFAIIPSPLHVASLSRTLNSSSIPMRPRIVSVAVKNIAFATATAVTAIRRGLSASSVSRTDSTSAPCAEAASRASASSAPWRSAAAADASSVPFVQLCSDAVRVPSAAVPNANTQSSASSRTWIGTEASSAGSAAMQRVRAKNPPAAFSGAVASGVRASRRTPVRFIRRISSEGKSPSIVTAPSRAPGSPAPRVRAVRRLWVSLGNASPPRANIRALCGVRILRAMRNTAALRKAGAFRAPGSFATVREFFIRTLKK